MEKPNNNHIDLAIRECNSKYCAPILKTVFEQPGIRLINLSNALHVPSSNLQRVLKRMMLVKPSLIYSDIIGGKTKGFWVSKDVEKYFGNQESLEMECPVGEDDVGVFAHWIQLEGTLKWKQRLLEVVKDVQDIMPEERVEFERLVRALIDSRNKKTIRDYLGQELYSQLMNYITEHNQDVRSYLLILTELYSKSWESALRLIDYIFDVVIYRNKPEAYRPYSTYEIEPEQFDSIQWAMEKMISYIRKEVDVADKDDIFRLISEKSALNNSIGFYIAEKISNGWKIIEEKI